MNARASLIPLTFEIDLFQVLQEFRPFDGFHLLAQAGYVFALDRVHVVQCVRKRQHRIADKLQLVFPHRFLATQIETRIAGHCEVRIEWSFRTIRILALEVFFPKFWQKK